MDFSLFTTEELIRFLAETIFSMSSDTSEDEIAQALTTLTDGDLGNNDLERIMLSNNELMMYSSEDDISVYQELSSRLEVIDTRLDWTNRILSEGFGFVVTFATVLIAGKFLTWLFKSVGV